MSKKCFTSFLIRDIIGDAAKSTEHESNKQSLYFVEDNNNNVVPYQPISPVQSHSSFPMREKHCNTTSESEKLIDHADEESSNSDTTDVIEGNTNFEDLSDQEIGLYTGHIKRKYPRERTTFTATQLKFLEELFCIKKYLTLIERSKVASHLDLSERQVKTWFQNRRTKYRRQKTLTSSSSPTTATSPTTNSLLKYSDISPSLKVISMTINKNLDYNNRMFDNTSSDYNFNALFTRQDENNVKQLQDIEIRSQYPSIYNSGISTTYTTCMSNKHKCSSEHLLTCPNVQRYERSCIAATNHCMCEHYNR